MRNIITDDGCLEIDDGIFFGAGVFETILINNGVKFLDFHMKRLKNMYACFPEMQLVVSYPEEKI